MNKPTPTYPCHRFPSEIISHAVWLYHRICLSFREWEELLAERGIPVTYETSRQWCQKFGLEYARKFKRRQGRLGDTWDLSVMPTGIHDNRPHANDRAAISHQPIRQGKWYRRRFKSPTQARRYLTIPRLTQILFRVDCHLLQAVYHRILRTCAYLVWNGEACA